MPAATVTTTATTALNIPRGSYGVTLANDSDTIIYYRVGGISDAAVGAGAGVMIQPKGQAVLLYQNQLSNDVGVSCYHAGTGSKTLTYDVFTKPMTIA